MPGTAPLRLRYAGRFDALEKRIFDLPEILRELDLRRQDWQLKLVSRMKWWRKLPGWHKREVAFRDWYVGLLERINLSNDASYDQAVRVLSCPKEVTGYREVRYPKQDKVREQVEAELTRQPAKLEVDVKRDVLDSLRKPTHV